MKNLTWKIGGEAGFGIMTTGLMFSRVAVRHGYHIFDYVEYPSLIRGGHNVYEVRISDQEVHSQEYGIDVLVALNQETVTLHAHNMKEGGLIFYDADVFQIDPDSIPPKSINLYNLPLARLIKEAGVPKVMENNVALGATIALLSMDMAHLNEVIESIFARKGEEIIAENKKAAQKGFDFVSQHMPSGFDRSLPYRKSQKKIIVTGNEAVGMGVLAAQCKLYVAYPMTPASSLLHFLAKHGTDYGMVVKHAEDEISVINMGIGAGYAGVRTMIGTSGGGFSLMTEGLGLCGITETPLVLFVAQRPGPATGMPTWTGQADLQFLIHASQDEFPRIILAPGDVTEAFYLTTHAFNLAEYYQTPVFVLSDKYLAEGHKSADVFDLKKVQINRGKLMSWEEGDSAKDYLRYKVTDDGIPKRALPGMKQALFLANSYEHDEYGWTSEESKDRLAQVGRRTKKMTSYLATLPKPTIYGEKNADLTLISWGSTKGPILQTLVELQNEGFKRSVNFLHIATVWPFPSSSVAEILTKAKKTLILEGNAGGQLETLIKQETNFQFSQHVRKYDGRPFYPADIKKKIQEVLA